MELTSSDFHESVSALLGNVSQRTEVAELRKALGAGGEHTRRRLVHTIQEFWQNPRVLENEGSRVLLARLTAASLPQSRGVVNEILQTQLQNDLHAELQFSLFVAFSDLPQLLSPTELVFVCQQVERFLDDVGTDTAQAAWMAGDLLGDHWPLEEAVPLLTRLAREAKHRAGREAAIHGLSHAIGRATKAQQWEIMTVLKDIAANDAIPAVRRYAESVMGDLRGI